MKRTSVVVCAILGVAGLWAVTAQAGKSRKPVSPKQVLEKKVDRHAVKSSLAVALADFSVRTGIDMQVDWKVLEAA
ncbi:MAG: hypothetical protein GY851_34820, partial [bacterium]|nr:hypothetical protein [bacterium]